MISKNLEKLLGEQVGHELSASHHYLAIAAYFADQGLEGWANFFFRQSDEERGHALKIIKFLLEVGVSPTMPAIGAATPKFKSALDAVSAALKSEQRVSTQFNEMAKTAMADGCYTSFQFVQWFIEEQVEEEASMQQLVDLLNSQPNLFLAQMLLPKE